MKQSVGNSGNKRKEGKTEVDTKKERINGRKADGRTTDGIKGKRERRLKEKRNNKRQYVRMSK
jgi:hypothetical protein